MTAFGVLAFGCMILSIEAITSAGVEAKNLSAFITLGDEASDPVPYMVSIQYRIKGRKWMHICGGSIISFNYILTAAHCFVPFPNEGSINRYRVIAGRTSLKSKVGSRHRIVSYTPHPQYTKEFEGYDIGVVKVSPRFKFNERTIDKIELNSFERVPSDIHVIFHGWGRTELGYPDKLQRSDLITLSQDKCLWYFEEDQLLSSTDLCVISRNFSLPSLGDSGGPLVDDEQSLQIGVCAYGSNYNFPVVFTRISEFSEWINKEISK